MLSFFTIISPYKSSQNASSFSNNHTSIYENCIGFTLASYLIVILSFVFKSKLSIKK
ncbi:hypothetical protein HOA93_02910 [bacterium]|nr:hypothetical protein [bacterium]